LLCCNVMATFTLRKVVQVVLISTRHCSTCRIHHRSAVCQSAGSRSVQRFAVDVNDRPKLTHRRMMSSTIKKSIDISGVYPPIATPFDDNQNVDLDRLSSNLKLWNNMPFRGHIITLVLLVYRAVHASVCVSNVFRIIVSLECMHCFILYTLYP